MRGNPQKIKESGPWKTGLKDLYKKYMQEVV